MRDAARRTRWSAAALTVCAMCHVVVFYNANLSWMKQHRDAKWWMRLDRNEQGTEIRRRLHEKYIEAWVDSTYVEVPVLGVRVAASDSSVFGSLAMVVLSVWVFFSSRRENHLVHLVLTNARKTLDVGAKRELLQGIVASQVLSPTSDDDTAYAALAPTAKPRGAIIPRTINKGLRYLPGMVIVLGIIFDVHSAWARGFLDSSRGRLVPMMIVAGISAFVCFHLAGQFGRYHKSTATLIRVFGKEVDKEAKVSVPPPAPDAPVAV